MKIENIVSLSNNFRTTNENKNSDGFGAILKNSIDKINEYEMQSQRLDQLMAVGDIENLHEPMIAAQKAEIALQFAVEVKNKVLDAYKEIMRLQV
ncbi:MAG: flagellar hook-basal body complex protein FliE [Bacillota bacterium]